MITIEQIHAINFAQYKQFCFDIEDGIHVISGKNRVGKSTIFEALYWCLYGKTARGMKTIRPYGAKPEQTCTVTVYGRRNGVSFICERVCTKNNTTVQIQVGKEKTPRDTGNLALTQEIIDKFLGMNADFFLGSTLFGNKSFRFTQAKDSERKELFEAALHLERFTNTKDRIVIQKRSMQNSLTSKISEGATLERQIVDMKGQVEKTKTEFEEEHGEDIRQLKNQIKEKSAEWNKIADRLKNHNLANVEDDFEVLSNEITKLETKAEDNHSILNRIMKLTICPECGQVISATHRKEYRNRLIDENAAINRKRQQHALRRDELTSIINRFEEKEKLGDEIDDIKHKLESIMSMKKFNTDSLELVIKTTEQQVQILTKEIRKLQKQVAILEFWELGFGRQGVISLLIDAAMEEFNEHCVIASQGLTDGLCAVQFDSTTLLKSRSGTSDKISMDCFIDGEKYDYNNLSQSEQQRIDICGMFGWQDMIASKTEAVNLMFFDEIFDGMDEDTKEQAFGYISKFGKNKGVYVISHSEDLRKRADDVIEITRTRKDGSIINVK